MRILITGASGNVGKGMIPKLHSDGHELVLYDVTRLPDKEPYAGHRQVQGDIQAGIGLERAAAGCDLVLHLPAWHGIHTRDRTEADFWRLNVDGTFWMFQAAKEAGIKRVVFLSSMAWWGHYDKYGFTKRVGEELCEYNRRNHQVRYVAIRPHGFVPWNNWVHGFGVQLLYGAVHRDDVLDLVQHAVQQLGKPLAEGAEPEAIVAAASRAPAYTEEQVQGWSDDPIGVCERIFPGSRALVEKYGMDIRNKPHVHKIDEGAEAIGYRPRHHFGTFLEELRRLDAEGGEEAVHAVRCPY